MHDDGKIDYSRYSYRELLGALDNINSRKYPKNYANLQAALEKIGPAQRAAIEGSPQPEPFTINENYLEDEPADPDHRRVKHLLTALAVAGYSGYLIWIDDITLPFNPPLHVSLSGLGETLAYFAFLFAIAVPASFAVDYIDERDNRKVYLLFALFSESVATGLILFASVISASPA